MQLITRKDCDECHGQGVVWLGDRHTGQAHRCHKCGARTALAFLLVRIGSWTSARWDQHVRTEFGDDIADALIKMLDSAEIPIEKFARSRARLDPTGTEQGKTRLVCRESADDPKRMECRVAPPANEYVADDGTRIPLTPVPGSTLPIEKMTTTEYSLLSGFVRINPNEEVIFEWDLDSNERPISLEIDPKQARDIVISHMGIDPRMTFSATVTNIANEQVLARLALHVIAARTKPRIEKFKNKRRSDRDRNG